MLMEKKRIEGLWDCAYCGRTGLKARVDKCDKCGHPRGPEIRFYLPTDIQAATLTKEEAEKTTNEPDWLCAYCNSYNSSNETVCEGCGASKEESAQNYGSINKVTGKSFFKSLFD